MLKYYAISKYNPKYYNEFGCYTLDEWTDVSDIGKIFNEKIITPQEYLSMENKYLNCLKQLLIEYEVKNMTIVGLEKRWSIDENNNRLKTYGLDLNCDEKKILKKIKDGAKCNDNETILIFRLIMRSCLWCRLINREKKIQVDMGHELYIHFYCTGMKKEQIRKINEIGLFVVKRPLELDEVEDLF